MCNILYCNMYNILCYNMYWLCMNVTIPIATGIKVELLLTSVQGGC